MYQLLDIRDTAWHASEVNSRSVGIEHAAIPTTLMATEAQIEASAELVAWLAALLGIPCDRAHVQGHYECSPIDNHRLCPEGALSVDRVVAAAHGVDGAGEES